MGVFSFLQNRAKYTDEQLNEAVSRSITDTLKIYNLQGYGSSPYSVEINEDTAVSLSAVWGCVKLLSDTFASLPFHVYKEDASGKSSDYNHQVYKLLKYQPVQGMTSYTWRSLAMSKVLLHGNFYAYIERDTRFTPINLIPILTDVKCEVIKGDLYYFFSQDDKDFKVPYYNMLHIKGYSEDGIKGKSVIQSHRDTLAINSSAIKASKDFYEKGAKLDGYLATDQVLREDTYKKVKESFNNRSSERVPLLDAGLQYKPIKLTPQDAQYIDTRKFEELDIARIFRVPPHMIGIMDRATWSNVEALGIEFSKYTMLPHCNNWEQEIDMKLLKENERDMYYSRFSLEGLMRADIKTRYESYKVAIQNGIKSINEVRALEDLNPIDGGDKHYVQGNNMVDINDDITLNENENEQGS